jgi:branched-subunit amino acid ABC-type transport system permease component
VEQFVRDLITTLVTAGLYTLMAAGLVLTYSTTRIFFLAFAGVAFSAAYVFFELNTGLGWPSWAAAMVVVLALCPLLGLLLEVGVFRRLARASETAQIVANVGILLALPALCVYVVDVGRGTFHWDIPQGATVLQVPGPGPQPALTFHLFSGVSISSDQLIVLAVALVTLAALTILLRVSNVGLRLRALADRRDLAAMRGISEPRMSRLAWVLGTVLAGVVGVVGAPLLHALNSDNYVFAVFIATCAAVIGGFRSVLLAALGVVAISFVSDLVFSYWPWASNVPGFNDSVPFVFLVVGLVVLGRFRGRVAGSISAEPPPPEYRRDLPTWRRMLPSSIGFLVLVVLVFFVLGSYWVGQFTQGLIFSLIFLSITVITGIGGMVSLAQAAFVSGGGLIAGMLIQRYGLPWVPALLCAVLVCVLLGVLVALPSLRLSGVALALSTLALGFICSNLVFQLSWLDNQNQGWVLTPPKIGPVDLNSTKTMAGVVLSLILLTVLMIHNLERSTTGRQMLAVRNAEAGAASVGISPVATKVKLFALSAGIAALGGVLLATVQGSFTNTSVTTLSGLLWLAAVVLFGVRRPAAAVIAGLFIGVFPSLLSGGFTLPFGLGSWAGTQASEIPTILFGLGAIFLARNPDGSLQGMARRNFERRERSRRRNVEMAEFVGDPSGFLVADRVGG